MCAWRPKHNLQETVLSFSCMCSRNWTQFSRLTSTFITKPYCWPLSCFLLYSLSIEFSIFLLKTLIHSLLREFFDSVILLWQMIPYFNTLLLYRTALQIKQTPAAPLQKITLSGVVNCLCPLTEGRRGSLRIHLLSATCWMQPIPNCMWPQKD